MLVREWLPKFRRQIEVPATVFAKHFGRYKEIAQREPVAIMSYGRTTGYFVTEHEYAEYQRLKALSRRVYHEANCRKKPSRR